MIKISNLTKVFDNGRKLFDNFFLDIEEGKINVILGESGSGKSTLLNCIAGLTSFEGSIPDLKVSYVYQEPILLSNLTVYDNLLLVNNDKDKIINMLNSLEISHKINSYPKDLSYGQKCRVSIARALLYDSEIILLDEALSNLDIRLKNDILELLKNLFINKTVIYVTHDIDEALIIGERIIILDQNTIKLDIKNVQTKYGENTQNRTILLDKLLKRE